ncbi:unnamed protein product [Ilex paraguariensis]|uniref:Uncharacterized protein n=1 Tax=Ilex paraguariensis TaxID=185542 RepID=A0ABC8QSV4_9AQUA
MACPSLENEIICEVQRLKPTMAVASGVVCGGCCDRVVCGGCVVVHRWRGLWWLLVVVVVVRIWFVVVCGGSYLVRGGVVWCSGGVVAGSGFSETLTSEEDKARPDPLWVNPNLTKSIVWFGSD